MNKKGMTLMELIISIAMLSVGLVFMYGLMVNLQNKKSKNDAHTDDLVKIAEIETEIQKSIMSFTDFGQDSVNSVVICDSGNDSSYDLVGIIITDNGKTQSKEIGWSKVGTNSSIIIKNKNESGVWNVERKWNLNESINNIDATIKCNNDALEKEVMCQLNFYLKDVDNNIIDAINVPLYYKTNSFNLSVSKTELDILEN